MIALEDCLAFCGVSEAEVLAIAEHEHIPTTTFRMFRNSLPAGRVEESGHPSPALDADRIK